MLTKQILEKAFVKYGSLMFLETEKMRIGFNAFLQPLRYKNKMYLSNVSTELSYNSTRKFLLISPVGVGVDIADGYAGIIKAKGLSLRIDHSELVYFKNEPVYCWSIVHVIDKEDENAD